MTETLDFQFAHPQDEAAVRALLVACGLPAEDIGPHLAGFLVARSGNEIVGCAGLEFCHEAVLLRSVAVAEPYRSQGLGLMLTKEILRFARHLEAPEVYLLTTTAERFFEKFGFLKIPREQAPDDIRTSKEFTSLCPSSAILMRKRIDLSQSC